MSSSQLVGKDIIKMIVILKEDEYLASFKNDKPVWSKTTAYIFDNLKEAENYTNLFGGSAEMFTWVAGSEKRFYE